MIINQPLDIVGNYMDLCVQWTWLNITIKKYKASKYDSEFNLSTFTVNVNCKYMYNQVPKSSLITRRIKDKPLSSTTVSVNDCLCLYIFESLC